MRLIFGLDLGVASIGWSAISRDENQNYKIMGMGSRIIPYPDNSIRDDFGKGSGESVNAARTQMRTARRNLDRYQLRRKALQKKLAECNMLPDQNLMNLSALQLYELRSKAASQQLPLAEFGRILLHMNQRRGYKHGEMNPATDKKERDWVATINSRYSSIQGKMTVGEFFYQELLQHARERKYYRIKEQIFPRAAYVEEFDKIWQTQSTYNPQFFTKELHEELRDEIIYFQRPLRSQKGLVSVCEFEGYFTKITSENTTKEVFIGPKVAPRSSPLFQVAKIWESINNITIRKKTDDGSKHPQFDIGPFKEDIFRFLNSRNNMSEAELFKLLQIRRSDGYYADQLISKKGLQGNLTLVAIQKALDDYEEASALTNFELAEETANHKVRATAETLCIQQIKTDCERQPLYQLWHTCYSIRDINQKITALQNRFNLPLEYATRLAEIDFSMGNFGNKSSKALRKLIPLLRKGLRYSDAMKAIGFDHSFSETSEQRARKTLLNELPLLQKNSLRQPVVEKILNQMINVVNAMIKEYGRPDEIRVELARELKQSKSERNEYFNKMNQRTKESEKIAERLISEYKVRPSRKNIEKWRLWHEVNGRCLYCNQQIPVYQFLNGIESDVEHIIPKSLFFDDSFANKTIAHIRCNSAKSNTTAYDYVQRLGEEQLDNYMKSVHDLYYNDKTDRVVSDESVYCLTGKISKSKFKRLQWSKEEIPKDFVERQLQETRFIARKTLQILTKVCREVSSTNGAITEKLRSLWGWDQILMNLSIPKFRQEGLTEQVVIGSNGTTQLKEKIPGWSKRDDNRHHAIDALVVACTRQGYIQKLNTLNSVDHQDNVTNGMSAREYSSRLTSLDRYLVSQRPFTTDEVQTEVEQLLVSYKAGKKVSTPGKRKVKIDGKKRVVQKDILVPRGPLSEQSVYGMIKVPEKDFKTGELLRFPVKYLFNNPHLIFKEKVKRLIETRLSENGNDAHKALASLKKDPLYIDPLNKIVLTFGTCFKEETVIKYPITSLTTKDVPYIIDKKIQKLVGDRLTLYNGKEKEAFRSPLYFNEDMMQPVLTVRCYARLESTEPVKRNDEGEQIGFAKPGNNHHVALYEDENGKLVESISTFWHSVERKAFFIKHFSREERDKIQANTVIKDPSTIWNKLMDLDEAAVSRSFLEKLPRPTWRFIISLQQNEMFVIGLTRSQIEEALEKKEHAIISRHLYRVSKLSTNNYCFRRHTATKVDDKYNGMKDEALAKRLKDLIMVRSMEGWKTLSPTKVSINQLGQVVKL